MKTKPYSYLFALAFLLASCSYLELHQNLPPVDPFVAVIQQQSKFLSLTVNAVCQGNEEGYVVVGRRESSQGGEFGYWVWIDENGQDRKTRNLGIVQQFRVETDVKDVIAVKGQGYAICGFYTSENDNKNYLTVDLLNENGSSTWTYNHTVPNSEARKILSTDDGGFLVIADVANQAMVLKLDAFGQHMWETNIASGNAYEIIKEENSNYAVLLYDSGLGKYVIYQLKDDQTEIGRIPIAEFFWQYPDFMKLDNGHYLVCSTLLTGDFANTILQVVNAQGEIEQDTTLDDLWTKSLAPTQDGGFILCGKTFGTGSADAFSIKYDENQQQEWQHFYGGNLSESADAIVPLRDGGFFMAGVDYTLSNADAPADDKGIYLLRTKKDGTVE